MKCQDFEKRLELLFDDNTPTATREELLAHLKACPDCQQLYAQTKEVLEAVTPQKTLQVPTDLKQRILRAAAEETNEERKRTVSRHHRWLRPLTASLSAAALIALVLILNPIQRYQAHAAGCLLRDAIAQIENCQSFYFEIDVRTLPGESFSYIDAQQPFLRHRMWVEPATNRWRLEKEGRIAIHTGSQILMWLPNSKTGWILPPDEGSIDGFAILLDPYSLLLREEACVATNKKATCTKQVSDNTITLTVRVPAEGDFSNNYMLNTSVSESNTCREYSFDRKTHALTGLKIIQLNGSEEKTIVHMKRIDYNTPLSASLFSTPQGIEWITPAEPAKGSLFTDITPEEAARKLFTAMQSWDEEVLQEVLIYYNAPHRLSIQKEIYAGCRLIEVRPHFRSGQYAGVFVPCLVRKPDGESELIILALRNDNQNRAWVADGGL